jgi:serine/threonine-protein kinase RsbT
MADALRIEIEAEADIVAARQLGRELAKSLGFPVADATLIAVAISEIARNITLYAARGEMLIEAIDHPDRRGIEITARDDGPGIDDVEQALQDGFSTAARMGLGLPGARRVMDEFTITAAPGQGTTVVMRKWLTAVAD